MIVQGARLPNTHFQNPNNLSLRCFGYGFPSLERITTNTEHRITFYNTGEISAEEGHIYTLIIPEQLRNQANEHDILIEVTLAYTARVRRTRQKTKSYLSNWLEWQSSYFDEPLEDFKTRASKEINGETVERSQGNGETVKWKIREKKNLGIVTDICRNDSTLQKDWTIIKAFNLSKEISFAIKAHKGWDKNKEEIPYALTVSIEAINSDIQIYEPIRLQNTIELEV